jgi:hypothetical protein
LLDVRSFRNSRDFSDETGFEIITTGNDQDNVRFFERFYGNDDPNFQGMLKKTAADCPSYFDCDVLWIYAVKKS